MSIFDTFNSMLGLPTENSTPIVDMGKNAHTKHALSMNGNGNPMSKNICDGKTHIFHIPFLFNNEDQISFHITREENSLGGTLCLDKSDYSIDVRNHKIIFYKQLKKNMCLYIYRRQEHEEHCILCKQVIIV